MNRPSPACTHACEVVHLFIVLGAQQPGLRRGSLPWRLAWAARLPLAPSPPLATG